MKTVKPHRLVRGSTIGVVSVSAPDAAAHPDRFQRGIEAIEARGYKVVVAPSATKRNGYLSGDEQEMARDLNALFADNGVAAIICAGGGTNANRLLRHVDYELIARNPKPFVGVSNPSVLLNAIHSLTGLVTFHGPAVVWNFGEESGLTDYTAKHFWSLLEDGVAPLQIGPTAEWHWHRPGRAIGRLIGGNLTSIQGLLGTPWVPDWRGAIFFWEDIAKPTNRLDMALTHFRDAGVFEQIAGMVVGTLVSCDPPERGQDLKQVLRDLTGEHDFPVLCGVSIGHTDDKATIPIGVEAEIDSQKGTIALLEGAVQ